jgi:hypothetical protein
MLDYVDKLLNPVVGLFLVVFGALGATGLDGDLQGGIIGAGLGILTTGTLNAVRR